jgi:hypothetical protein
MPRVIILTGAPRQVFHFKHCRCRGRFVQPCKLISPLKMQIKTKRPLRVGWFGIGLDACWPQFKGLKQRLEGYVRVVRDRLKRPGVEADGTLTAAATPCRLGSRRYSRFGNPRYDPARLADWWQYQGRVAQMERSAGLRPAAARRAERAQEIPCVFGLLNVLRLTEPRSAAAEIDLGNTPSRCARHVPPATRDKQRPKP